MLQKNVFALQLFSMGGGQKQHRSLGVVIPAAIVREFNLTPDTIFALRITPGSRRMTLEPLECDVIVEEVVAANESA